MYTVSFNPHNGTETLLSVRKPKLVYGHTAKSNAVIQIEAV